MAAALYVPIATEPYDQPAARQAARAAVAAAAAAAAGASGGGGEAAVYLFDRGTAASIGTTPMLVGRPCGLFGGSLANLFVAMVVTCSIAALQPRLAQRQCWSVDFVVYLVVPSPTSLLP
jgi:hypothetical protein